MAIETRANITVQKSLAEKTITEIRGNATAAAKSIRAQAQVNATRMVIKATSDAYKELDTKLGINPLSGLDEFIYYSDLQNAEDTDILFNINKAFIKM